LRGKKGLSSWDLLWVDASPECENQLRTFLLEDAPPREIVITGPCGALLPDVAIGTAMYANEVLDPEKGPYRPMPTRALSIAAVQKCFHGTVRTGKLLTTQVPCVTPHHKLESGHGYGAFAVDQQSALLCRPCFDYDVGHAVIRFVLDPAEVDLTPQAPGVEHARFRGSVAVERSLFQLLTVL
jgi:nucleoside phosphorylase